MEIASASFKAVVAMSHISPLEADALLSKLLSERIPLHAFFKSVLAPKHAYLAFVDSKTADCLGRTDGHS